jgi:two-component system response regulator QseB
MKKNWIDIVQYIRDKKIVLPIIIISWINDIWFLKLAFDKWANDYICKPFRINELEIRVLKWFNNFFSNNKLVNKSFLKYDSLIYDFTQNIFYFNWYELILTKTSKYLLLLFVSKSEELLSEIYLVEKIWWDSNLFDRNLRIVIYRLKKSLELYWIDWWIKNIRWEWYILEKK